MNQKLKYGFRPFIIFEELTGKIYNPTLYNNIILLYCFEAVSYKNYEKTLEQLIDECDAEPSKLLDFLQWLSKKIGHEGERLGLPTDFGQ